MPTCVTCALTCGPQDMGTRVFLYGAGTCLLLIIDSVLLLWLGLQSGFSEDVKHRCDSSIGCDKFCAPLSGASACEPAGKCGGESMESCICEWTKTKKCKARVIPDAPETSLGKCTTNPRCNCAYARIGSSSFCWYREESKLLLIPFITAVGLGVFLVIYTLEKLLS